MDFLSTTIIFIFFACLFLLLWFLIYSVTNGNAGVIDLYRKRIQAKQQEVTRIKEESLQQEVKQFILERDKFKCKICKENVASEIISISGIEIDYKSPNKIISACNNCKKNREREYYRLLNRPLKEKVLDRDNHVCKYCGRHATEVYQDHPERGLILIDDDKMGTPWDMYISVCSLCSIDKATPKRFEKIIGRVFERYGYAVNYAGGSGDGGIDLTCYSGKQEIIVQCKKYSGKVGVSIIRDFYGTLLNEKADFGFVVTTGEFTSGAKEWANDKQIVLIDRTTIHKFLQNGPYFSLT